MPPKKADSSGGNDGGAGAPGSLALLQHYVSGRLYFHHGLGQRMPCAHLRLVAALPPSLLALLLRSTLHLTSHAWWLPVQSHSPACAQRVRRSPVRMRSCARRCETPRSRSLRRVHTSANLKPHSGSSRSFHLAMPLAQMRRGGRAGRREKPWRAEQQGEAVRRSPVMRHCTRHESQGTKDRLEKIISIGSNQDRALAALPRPGRRRWPRRAKRRRMHTRR